MFPQEGYKILEPPSTYAPIRTQARKLLVTPTPLGTPLYAILEENRGQQFDVPKEMPGGLPLMKPKDYQYFGVNFKNCGVSLLTFGVNFQNCGVNFGVTHACYVI
ncbi:putative splicing factor 3B subunit 1 [Helianthus anomalus]